MTMIEKSQCINHTGNPNLYRVDIYYDKEGKPHRVALCPVCVMNLKYEVDVNLHAYMPLHRPKEPKGLVYGQQ